MGESLFEVAIHQLVDDRLIEWSFLQQPDNLNSGNKQRYGGIRNRCTHYILLDGRFDLMPCVQSGPSNHFAIQVNPMMATPIVRVGILSKIKNSTNHQVLFSFMDFLKGSALRTMYLHLITM